MDLEGVRARYELARLAGLDADEAGHGWDRAKIGVLINSWSDVSGLHDEVLRLRRMLAAHERARNY